MSSYRSPASPSPTSQYYYSSSPIHNHNHSPSSSPSRSQAKRKQVKNACINCQKACKKCDDQRPCSRCVKYGIEDGCINSQRKERKRKDGSYSALESLSERSSSPLPATSRSGREIKSAIQPRQRAERTERGSLRSSSRSIRTFSRELLQTLQDEEAEYYEDEEDDSANEHVSGKISFESSFFKVQVDPVVTEEFKTLAQLCSELHTIILSSSTAIMPQIPPMMQFYNPNQQQKQQQQLQESNQFSIPLTQAYPMPVPHLYSPVRAAPPSFIQHQQHIASDFSYLHQQQNRIFLNRTPPEELISDSLPSPSKSEVEFKTESSS